MDPWIAEWIGTALLILMGGGVVANVVLNQTKGQNSGWIVITTGWALGVFVGVVVAGPHSGAHLNPAVSIALWMTDKMETAQVAIYIAAQMGGAATGAFLVWLFYRHHFDQTESPGLKKAIFCTDPAIRHYPTNVFNEVLGTFVLIFVVLWSTGASMAGTDGIEIPIGLGAIGALPVAFLVWGIGLSLGGTTGYAINPARDLGPRIVHALLPIKDKADSDWSYAWVPVLGPMIGAALAGLLYNFLI
jgi:glycerol uptake facilitator protein